MSENDPDPNLPDEGQGRSELGGRPESDAGDPTQAPSIAADEPGDGEGYPVGGGLVTEEENAPPVADPGPAS
jgi:hypothetical protein